MTAESIFLSVFIAAGAAALVWWVANWRFPVPATITGKVVSIQEEADQYTLQLTVEKVTHPEPVNIWQRLARPSVIKRAPQPGQAYTYRVEKKKMRADLHRDDYVNITGRVLQPVTGGIADLSIHEATPAKQD